MAVPSLSLDRSGLALTLAIGGLILPGMIFFAAARLFWHLDESEWPIGESVAAIGCVAAGLLILRLTLRELRACAGVRIHEQGIAVGLLSRREIPWSEIRSIESGEFGVLMLKHGNTSTRIAIYFFEQRDKLAKYIQERVGQSNQQAP